MEYNNIEIEEMRNQMAMLKDKLNHENIVNDKLMRDLMKQKAKSIKTHSWISLAGSIMVIVMAPSLFPHYGVTWWCVGYTELMMSACIIATIIYFRNFSPDMMNGNLLDVAKRMRKMKRDDRRWHRIGYPMLAVWVVWFVWDLLRNVNDAVMVRSMIVGLAIGLVAGGIIGEFMRKKDKQDIDDIIKQAEGIE